jgi:5-methyltetrahydrofolate--homocysteine methyltransferase
MIGGATTSELHTALKIAPVYSAPIVWMKDASQNVLAATRLLNPQQREDFTAELQEKYQHLRTDHENSSSTPLSLEEARKRKPNLF